MSDQAQKEAERAQGPPGNHLVKHRSTPSRNASTRPGERTRPETLGCGEYTSSSDDLSRGPVIETDDGREMWLDYVTDPHNAIGWVVDVSDSDIPGGESDSLTVAEAIALAPDRRGEIIEATRQAIVGQCEHVTLWDKDDRTYPPEHWGGWLEATAKLARQLAEVAGE